MSDIENVIAALNLEYGAHRRYEYQAARSPFSQLNVILEGARRTEGEHVEAMTAYLRAQQPNNPGQGRGFATMLTHLRLDLAFEETAVEAYARFAKEAEDPALRRTFRDLLQSEAGHINMFKRLIAQIEANEYPVIVYCPVCGWEMDFGPNPAEGVPQRCAQCKAQITLEMRDGDFVAVKE